MIVSTLITRINQAYRGNEEDAPAVGDVDYSYWLETANRKKDEWARDTKQKWASLWEERNMGVVSTTNTYDMDDDFIKPSDSIIVLKTPNNRIYFDVFKPQDRGNLYTGHRGEVYFSGFDPVILSFNQIIQTTDQIVGGTLLVPAYFMPDDMVKPTDEVPIDDPNWLVYAVASELAFNDSSYVEKYDDINVKANNLYLQMISANRSGTATTGRRAPTVNPMSSRNTFMPRRTRSDQ